MEGLARDMETIIICSIMIMTRIRGSDRSTNAADGTFCPEALDR
jgi:hypothetical protein